MADQLSGLDSEGAELEASAVREGGPLLAARGGALRNPWPPRCDPSTVELYREDVLSLALYTVVT